MFLTHFIIILIACKNGNLDIVKYLVNEAKANVHIKSMSEMTTIMCGKFKITWKFTDTNKNSTILASIFGYHDIVKVLTPHYNKDQIDSQDMNGKTALMHGMVI